MRRQGSVLVALLWCLAILSVIVVGALHSTSMSLASTKNYADKIQARYIALAGAERAKALIGIAHPDFREDLERQAHEHRLIPRGVVF